MMSPTPHLMPRRAIGKSGLQVSVMGLGASPLGGLYKASSTADAIATVGAAMEAGIDLVDVAPHYGQGLAERRVGEALASLPDATVTLSTKVGRILEFAGTGQTTPNWPEALPYRTVYDCSERGIRRSVDDSIARLGGKQPSVLLLHDPDRYAEGPALSRLIAEAYRTLAALRAQGRVKAIGLGVNGPHACHVALDVGAWDCFLLAGTVSLIRRDDEGLLDRCASAGVAVLIGGPFMSGALAGGMTWRYRPIPPEIAADIARARSICAAHDTPIEAAALQFPLHHPAVASVVVGMRSPDEVRRNTLYLHHPVPEALWGELAAAGLISDPQVAQ